MTTGYEEKSDTELYKKLLDLEVRQITEPLYKTLFLYEEILKRLMEKNKLYNQEELYELSKPIQPELGKREHSYLRTWYEKIRDVLLR